MAQLSFNAAGIDTTDNFELIPKGLYLAELVEDEMVQTKSGNGSYLKCQFEIIEGPHAGRKVFHNFNLDNPNQQAVEIARKQLAQLCEAQGKQAIQDSSELYGTPITIRVGIKKDKEGQHEDQNVINAFKAASGVAIPPKNGAAPAAEAQHVPQAQSVPPWKQ